VGGGRARDRLHRDMSGLGGLLFVFIFIVALLRSDGSTWLPRLFWVSFGKFVLLAFVLAPIVVLSSALDGGFVGGALFLFAVVLLFAPAFVITRTAVPLGWPRLAYWTARYCRPMEVISEYGAGAALYGALALARKPSGAPAIDWLQEKIARSQTMRGAGVTAAGLLAALRGNREGARSLFLIADAANRGFISRRARAVARDWLVADAAGVGNWREVIRLNRPGLVLLRWARAVARMAERLIGEPAACRDWQLRLWWLVAPRRRATHVLLRRALAVPRVAKPVVEQSTNEPPAAKSLPDALAGLAQELDSGAAQDGNSLARALRQVGDALDSPATRSLIRERFLGLGVDKHDHEAVTFAVRQRLADLIVPLIEEAPRLAAGYSEAPIVDQAVGRVRLRWFRDVEAQCRDYNDRYEGKSSLDAVCEWTTWATTRGAAERLLTLAPDSEQALFQTMYVPACNFAVFQHNVCKRTVLAHEIYAWLHRHAGSDDAALKLLAGNIKASQG
jgi:hypothetical protein